MLVPHDVGLAMTFDHEYEFSKLMLKQLWRGQYWSSMILGFIVFPMIGEYIVSGGFTNGRRLRDGLLANFWFYVMVSIPGVVFLILIIVFKVNDSMHMDLFSFLLAVNNTFSLVCILLFLSYGVVAIPKKYLHKKSLEERL